MDIIFSPEAQEDYIYWKQNNPVVLSKIKRLLKDISNNPYNGIGKPERLKYGLSGKWSRRINSEHRIIYIVNEMENNVYILALRYHYSRK